MTLIRLPLVLVFVALLAACSDNQKAAENQQETVQKELTPEERLAKLQKEAETGNAKAQFDLGVIYGRGEGVPENFAKALEWCQKAAEQKYAPAQYQLGKLYAHGAGVSKDAAKALEWYQKAAAQGYADAQFNLGWMYDQGNGVPKDTAKVVEWWQKAAAQGHVDAEIRLKSAFGRVYTMRLARC